MKQVIGLSKAAELHRRYGPFAYPIDIEDIATREGLKITDWPLLPPVDEVKVGRSIGLRKGLSDNWRRWDIAHALGHHLLHHGNQLLAPSSHQAEARA
ncbi:MAG: hypothetical protein V1932_05520 [Chloroflexota bacterium]